jgi:hypothetical protein
MSLTPVWLLLFGVTLLWSAAALRLAGGPSCHTTPASGADRVAPPPRRPAGWQVRPVRDLSEAEYLFDWLDSQRCADRELVTLPDETFAVRFHW